MPRASVQAQKRDSLNLRISAAERLLITHAAEATGKTKTDFVLDAVRLAAQEALLERKLFGVSAEGYAHFAALLDAPPRADERLRRLMRTAAPWDET